MKVQTVRQVANGILSVFCLVFIVQKLISLTTFGFHLFWGVPAFLVACLNLYFLTQSIVKKPKDIDTSLTTFLISVGGCLGFAVSGLFVTYPVMELPFGNELKQLGSMLSLMPYPFIVWALLCLGKCLTVIPEAHTVVAHGIYKYSRHPLYVCYMVWAAANVLMFPSLPMISVSAGHILLLFLRLKREEKLLLAAFPEYEEYYKTTGLIGRKMIFDPSMAVRS